MLMLEFDVTLYNNLALITSGSNIYQHYHNDINFGHIENHSMIENANGGNVMGV